MTRGYTDKLYHVAGFVLLVVLAGNAWRLSLRFMLSMVGLAIILELSQFLVEGRGVFWIDFAANLIGVVVGLLLLQTMIMLRRRIDSGGLSLFKQCSKNSSVLPTEEEQRSHRYR